MEIITKVSVVRIHFSHPESDGKSSDGGVGGRIGILNDIKKCSGSIIFAIRYITVTLNIVFRTLNVNISGHTVLSAAPWLAVT